MADPSVAAPAGAEPIPGVLTVGDVMSTTSRAISANLGPFLGLAALCQIPNAVLLGGVFFLVRQGPHGLFDVADPDPAQIGLLVGGGGLLLLVQAALGFLAQGVMMHATLEYLAGRRPSISGSLAVVLNRFWPILGTALILAIVTGIGTLLCLVPGIFAMCVFQVAVPACIAEELGPAAALERSWQLTRGNWGVIFGILLLAVLIVTGISFLGGLLALAGPAGELTSQILQGIVQMVLQGVLGGVIYARLRGVLDGIDVHALAEVFR